MVFFSKNKRTAIARIKKLAKRESYYRGKTPVLAKKQIAHVSGWKTWRLLNNHSKQTHFLTDENEFALND